MLTMYANAVNGERKSTHCSISMYAITCDKWLRVRDALHHRYFDERPAATLCISQVLAVHVCDYDLHSMRIDRFVVAVPVRPCSSGSSTSMSF
jgi:hypothetical protein